MSDPTCKQCGRGVTTLDDFVPSTCGGLECQRKEACDIYHHSIGTKTTKGCPAGKACKHRQTSPPFDLTKAEKGIYELTETVVNPNPHRGRNAWCFQQEIRIGVRFACRTSEPQDGTRSWIEFRLIGDRSSYRMMFFGDGSFAESGGMSEAFARAIVAKLKKSEPRNAREVLLDNGEYYEAILDQLVKDGKITLIEIKEAFDRYYNSPED